MQLCILSTNIYMHNDGSSIHSIINHQIGIILKETLSFDMRDKRLELFSAH